MQGQFSPYFILTISALVTLPLSYSLLKPNKGQIYPNGNGLLRQLVADGLLDIEDTAPRIKSDFKPTDDALIRGQKRKQWRRERRLKRIVTVAIGWSTIALMMYLIAVTKITVAKIWDPYDILDISRVRCYNLPFRSATRLLIFSSLQVNSKSRKDTEIYRESIIQIKRSLMSLKIKRWRLSMTTGSKCLKPSKL